MPGRVYATDIYGAGRACGSKFRGKRGAVHRYHIATRIHAQGGSRGCGGGRGKVREVQAGSIRGTCVYLQAGAGCGSADADFPNAMYGTRFIASRIRRSANGIPGGARRRRVGDKGRSIAGPLTSIHGTYGDHIGGHRTRGLESRPGGVRIGMHTEFDRDIRFRVDEALPLDA